MHSLRFCALICCLFTGSQSKAEVTITPDVVYGHKFGLAMTFDVFTPPEPNGAAVLFMVSGGWYSAWAPAERTKALFRPLTEKGFTVFAVRHGSSPKFSIPEAVADVRRSVRFIRLNAERFKIDSDRLGVYGYSAGGHLSLMLGTTSDDGKLDAKDPVDRASNHVASVVAFVAPTDLTIMVSEAPERLEAYARFPALELEMDAAKAASPLMHVSANVPPTLLIAGDKDKLVPVQHSRNMLSALKAAEVKCNLIEISGAGHGFQGDDATLATEKMVAWFVDTLQARQDKSD